MTLELISTRRCPFVQRSIILLAHKHIPHELTFVELDSPPDWFKAISPFGQVPVLRVNGRALFESAVINEYLDETTPDRLHPDDPLERAYHRSWIEFSGPLLGDSYKLMTVPDQDSFEQICSRLHANLARVERELAGPLFSGERLALVDVAFAPLFIRLAILRARLGLTFWAGLPGIDAWSQALLALPAVQAANRPELPDLYWDLMQSSRSYAATLK